MKLGQLLVKKGIIDADQLAAALAKQKDEGTRLGEVLVGMGVVARRDVLDALRTQPEFLADSTCLHQVESEVIRAIPRTVARRLRCLAVSVDDERVTVAMTDPLNSRAITELEQLTGKRVEPRLAEETDLDDAIEHHFRITVGTVFRLPQQDAPDEVVSVVQPHDSGDADRGSKRERRRAAVGESDSGSDRGRTRQGRRRLVRVV